MASPNIIRSITVHCDQTTQIITICDFCGMILLTKFVTFQMICKPLRQFTEYVGNEGVFRKSKDELAVRENIIHGLEMLIGCCKATRVTNQTEIFEIVEPSLQATIKVLGMNY